MRCLPSPVPSSSAMSAPALPHPVTSAPISPAALGAVRCLLQAHFRNPLADPALRKSLRLLCDDARRRGMRAEQIIVLLKQAWLSLPEIHLLYQGGPYADQLARIVSLCIEEYYGARPSRLPF